MKYSKLCCEECIVYRVHKHLVSPEKCYKCGETSMWWFQYEGGNMGLKCSECGARIIADLNTPCELEYNTMFMCHIRSQKVSHHKILAISKLIERTALETYALMKNDGILIEANFYDMSGKLTYMDENEITYDVEPYDPRNKYFYSKNCGYLYCRV